MDNFLNISHYISRSTVNGPGVRFTIWVQGCKLRCPGCFNKKLQDFNNGKPVKVEELFNLIKNTKDIDGVTFSGGEPFEQSEKLTILSKLIKSINLNILCYTGYKFEDINKNISFLEFLNLIDILIDGPFQKEKLSNHNFVGSENQKIHVLNKELVNNSLIDNILNYSEITIDETGIISLTGFPSTKLKKIIKGKIYE